MPYEECYFDIDELSAGIIQQRPDDRIEDILDSGVLDRVIGPIIVLIHRLEPSHVLDIEVSENGGTDRATYKRE